MSTRKPFTKILFESPSIRSGEELEIKKSDFEFEKKLGDGAFGHVWKVRHRQSKQIYALKQVAKEKVIKMQSQFRREVYIMYNLNHPHIAKLFNHFEDEKSFYLILEFAEGGNLFHRLHKQKHFMECEAAQYFREVLMAVDYLHSHNPAIIHRDIKPENILLDKDSRVKLTDFGWSNYFGDEVEPRTTICGTPEYLPPEMVEHKTHDTSADIWCLGVLLYEMLVGHTPFKSQAKKNMLLNISMCKPKFPLSFPPQARDLISKMLLKSTADRLKVSEIIEHPWLKSIPEMKETPRLKYSSIPLPQYHGKDYLESIPVDFKCYKVIGEPIKEEIKDNDKLNIPDNKSTNTTTEIKSGKGSSNVSNYSLTDSDLSLSFSESIKGMEENTCRESLRNLAGNIEETQNQIKFSKNNIKTVEYCVREEMEKVKRLESDVKRKEDELGRICNSVKTIKDKMDDLSIESENLFVFEDTDQYKSKMQELKKSLTKKTKSVEKLKESVHLLKVKIANSEKLSSNKMKELKTLNEFLTAVKQEAQRVHKQSSRGITPALPTTNSQVSSELCEDIRKKINETITKVITSDEAEELLGRIKNSLRSITLKNSLIENKMIELKRDFEERKFNFLVEAKMRKEKIVAQIKENNENIFSAFYEQCHVLKAQLREDLKLARESEHKFGLSFNEYDKIVQKFLVLNK